MKGLIIKKYWIEKIFYENKIWEIRGSNTKIRGRIFLIESGSGHIVGECEIIDSILLSEEEYRTNTKNHKINTNEIKYPYKKTYAWIIKNAFKYEKPVPYKHPQGAVIWVNIV